jgi:TetR/AcrR family transcriptional regulator
VFSKFLNLKSEKQEKILEAAIKEFADKGFKKASTNEIIKEAEISKGILFHYFGNKKNLFIFVYDYCVELCMTEFSKKVDWEEKDFFAKLRQISSVKFEITNKHTKIFKFFEKALSEECAEVEIEIEERNKKLSESSYSKLFKDIDVSKFRDGIDVGKAINIVMWTLEGFGTSELKKVKAKDSKGIDYRKTSIEMDIYMDIFKKCFYK